MVKGLHDIKTMFHDPRKEKRSLSLTRGILRVDVNEKRPLRIPKKREAITHPRTWVFSTKPKFTRYQKAFGKGLSIERAKEPAADVYEKMDNLVVMAKIPGVNREDIHCDVKGDILSIHAVARDKLGEKKYMKEILLPFIVKEDSIKISYKNGILEVNLLRREKEEGGIK